MRMVKFTVGLVVVLLAMVALSAFLMDRNRESEPAAPEAIAGMVSQPAPINLADECAKDGAPCSDPNNPKPQSPVCKTDCCSDQYHDCDGLACICGPKE